MKRPIRSHLHSSRVFKTVARMMSLLLGVALFVTAQEQPAEERAPVERRFETFALGLSLQYTLIQDQDGFLWIGTPTGLHQWNGRTTRTYAPANSGISNALIFSLYEDRNGILWIGTGNGLNRYDKTTNAFTVYQHDPNDSASLSFNTIGSHTNQHVIAEDQQGFLWVGTKGGLNCFDRKQQTFRRYGHDPQTAGSLPGDEIGAVLVTRDGTLWVGTQRGVCRFQPRTDQFICYAHNPDNPHSLSNNTVHVLYEDQAGTIWIGTPDGLNRFDPTTDRVTVYRHDPVNPGGLPTKDVVDIVEDNDGYLWLSHYLSAAGVSVFDPRTETFVNYRAGESSGSLGDNIVRGLLKDRQGIIWATGESSTLSKYDPAAPVPFTMFHHIPDDPARLKYDGAAGMVEGPDGRVWLPTWGTDGLMIFDPKTGKLVPQSIKGTEGVLLSTGAMLDDGTYWVSDSAGTLYEVDLETMSVMRSFTISNGLLPDIQQDLQHPEILWIATVGEDGLTKLNRVSGEITKYRNIPGDPASLSSSSILSPLIQDPARPDIIWVGTFGQGLNKFNKRTGKVEAIYRHDDTDPNSLGNDSIGALLLSSAGEYWIGTMGGGLHKLDPDSGQFTNFSQKNGLLPSDGVYAVLEDRQGDLWLHAGDIEALIRFTPATGDWKVYDRQDGIECGSSWPLGHLRTSTGKLWFSGAEGVVRVDPSQIKENTFKPPVYITHLTQAGSPINLPQTVERTTRITLDWHEPYFEFEAAALNYKNPGQNQYRYMLEGWDKDWLEAGTDNKGRYSGLTGGTYTLKVIGSNNDGVWSDQIAELQVIVTTPWWNTWWFQGGLAALVLGGMVAGLVLRVRIAELRRKELEIKVEERTRELAESNNQLAAAKEKALEAQRRAEVAQKASEVANKAKSQFLSNMSHELRTPLNSILGYAQILTRDHSVTAQQQDGLNIMYQSGRHLLTLIDDILDLSKVEAGKLELLPATFHFPTFLEGIAGIIRMRTEEKSLLFELDTPTALPEGVIGDEKRLRQVLINLLGNAVKFTKQGKITLRVTKIDSRPAEAQQPNYSASVPQTIVLLRFEVIDTGVGMEPEQLETIFKPFEQVGDSESRAAGTGLGLAISRRIIELMGSNIYVKSQSGHGSTFWFDLELPTAVINVSAAQQLEQSITGYKGWQLTVAVADDKLSNRLVLVNLLEPLGFKLVLAENGQELVNKVRDTHPDIVLTDLVMPGKSGFEAIREIRQMPEGRDIPIIAISASVFEADREQSAIAGCNTFLTKPLVVADLLEALATHASVEWVYADALKNAPQEGATPEQGKRSLTVPPYDEVVLPAEELEHLYILALGGDMDEIDRYAMHLEQLDPAYAPLARRLRGLAREFEDQAILTLIEKYRE